MIALAQNLHTTRHIITDMVLIAVLIMGMIGVVIASSDNSHTLHNTIMGVKVITHHGHVEGRDAHGSYKLDSLKLVMGVINSGVFEYEVLSLITGTVGALEEIVELITA